MSRPLRLIVAGDPARYTGGTIYDARIAAALNQAGLPVEMIGLSGRFPDADAAAVEAMSKTLAGVADGECVIIDGLALGGLAETIAQHAARLRVVALIHHPLADESGLDQALVDRLYHSERAALRHASWIVTTSGFTACRLVERYGVNPERLNIVEPGLDKPERREPMASRPPRLLCVAGLIPRKGHTVLVEALARVADLVWHCDCIGDTHRDRRTTAKIRAAIARHRLTDRITLHGSRPPASLSNAYDAADVFVLPSYYEGYGMVIIEALAHGLPVVTSTGGALADTLPGDAGMAVPPGDIAALAEVLRRLLTEPDTRAELAAGARRAAAARPSWADAGRRFADVLDRVRAA